MKLSYKKRTSPKLKARKKKKVRIRKKVFGNEKRPRLTFFKSLKHVYAQVIDDSRGETLIYSSSKALLRKEGKAQKTKTMKELSEHLGMEIAKKSIEKKLSRVVFDRNGYPFHGRVKAFVEGARKEGLNF